MNDAMHEPYISNPQVVFSWKAPLRAYKKRGKQVMRFYIAVSFLLSAIVFFFGDKILIIPILALLFFFYVLTITPPPNVDNKITIFGIETAGITLRWEVLSHFYYTKRFGYNVLTLVSHAPYFYHAYMIVPEEVKNKVTTYLSQHIVFMEKPQRNITDRMVEWLSNLIPDDEETHESFSQKPQEGALSLQTLAPTK